MTANRRIFWNVVATYGRSLYALVCGLFTARWVLMTLGEVDYGLVGVVGGVVGFLSLVNGLMATAVSRFYAFSVGQAQVAQNESQGLDECRRWFNVAVTLHTLIPLVSLVIGYPIGEWAVRHYLTIPPERIEACVWVFRISCCSCLISMMSVPYHAMYSAKQEIAELTIYGFITTTLNVAFLCYMVTHQGDWFVRYVGWTAFLSIAPSLVISGRAFVKYQECRFIPRYFFDWQRIREMAEYAGCRFLTTLAIMSSYQGITILVNKMLGPACNAAMSVSNTIWSHSARLSDSFLAALTPAVTNASGAGDTARVRRLACRTSVCSSLSIAVFAIPLGLEAEEILRVWLKNPPAQADTLCVLLMTAKFIDQLAIGQCLSVLALKNIAKFQLYGALAFALPFPIAWSYFRLGGGLEGVGMGFIVLYLVGDLQKVYFAKKLCEQPILLWVRSVLLPVLTPVFAACVAGGLVRLLLPASFGRIVCTTVVVEIVFLPIVWFVVLTSEERLMFHKKIRTFLHIS